MTKLLESIKAEATVVCGCVNTQAGVNNAQDKHVF